MRGAYSRGLASSSEGAAFPARLGSDHIAVEPGPMERSGMERRRFIAVLTGAVVAAPFTAAAVPPRIGLLAQDLQPGFLETFRGELKRSGYTEGQDIGIEARRAAGHGAR